MPLPIIPGDPSQPQSEALKAYVAGKPYNSRWNAYYSKLRIAATSGASGGPYTVAAGNEFIGFGYAKGTDMGPGGVPGQLATYADTNILTPSQTVAGEALEVDGVGVIVLGQTDALILKWTEQNISIKVRMNGNQDYPMGIPSMVPGPGGLHGASEAQSVYPDQLSQVAIQIGMLTNGLPHISNFYPLPEPMIWASAGHADSTLNVIMKTERTTTTPTQYSGATRAAVAGGATTSGTAAYVSPSYTALWIDYMVVIVGRTILPESSN